MNVRLLVDLALAASAQADMMKALGVFNETTKAVKAAADELAGEWEGDSKEAFVQLQNDSYNFYVGIGEVARGGIAAVQQIMQKTEAANQQTVSIVKS